MIINLIIRISRLIITTICIINLACVYGQGSVASTVKKVAPKVIFPLEDSA